MRSKTLPALLLMFFAVACSAPKQTFTVQVMNISPRPLSAGLVKNGPAEPEWSGPERIALQAPQLGDRKWGTLISPGQTKVLTQTGSFANGELAILRVYAGDLTIGEMIAYGRNDPGRLDVYLWPGQSGYVIDVVKGALVSKPLEQLPPTPPTTRP